MLKHSIYGLTAIALIFCFLLTGSKAFAQEEEIVGTNDTSSWILPFFGTHGITCGPSEGSPGCLHTGSSAEAIDYPAINGAQFDVLSPADGTVLDICTVSDFGTVLRINHNGTYSFFAHLDPNSITVTANQTVRQGSFVARTGSSGTGGSNNHLHFEARRNNVAACGTGSGVYTGNPRPMRSIPGTRWNPWYSPPPNAQRDSNRRSGAAQSPENSTRPSRADANARHLSNQKSPPNVPAGWASNVTATQLTLHFGAAPNTPNTGWSTVFQVHEMILTCGRCWRAVPGGPDLTAPAYTRAISHANRSEENGQLTFLSYDRNVTDQQNEIPRYWEILSGNSASNIPALTVTYRTAKPGTTLDFCASADRYTVYEYHGGSEILTYSGPACRIQVSRDLVGSINQYRVRAKYFGTWYPYSAWIIVHF